MSEYFEIMYSLLVLFGLYALIIGPFEIVQWLANKGAKNETEQ